MNVFEALKKEHRIFRKLLGILEGHLLEESEAAGREALRRTLDVLLPALETHEEIEESVLGTATYATEKKARKGLEAAAAGHRELHGACAALRGALLEPDGPSYHQVAYLVHSLTAAARRHFLVEERQLWPHFHRSWPKIDFPRHAFLTTAICQRVSHLERDIRSLKDGRRSAVRRVYA